MSFVEHFIYIRYLQGEFKYKLRMFGDAREFYEKAVKIGNRLNKYDIYYVGSKGRRIWSIWLVCKL